MAASASLSPQILRSALLTQVGVPHGFTTKCGGVSAGAFCSLNFGNPGDLPPEQRDSRSNILANWELVRQELGVPAREIVEVHQVHGASVHVVGRGRATHAGPSDTKADAVVCDDPKRMVAVRVADCTPVLISTDDGRIVAAVHAGWRGVAQRVLEATVVHIAQLGKQVGVAASAERLVVAIGPCIGFDAFEVGSEVAAEFTQQWGSQTPRVKPAPGGKSGQFLVDLQGLLRDQAMAAGVPSTAIDVLAACTVRDKELFFSHRRDRGVTGRMVGVIGAAAK